MLFISDRYQEGEHLRSKFEVALTVLSALLMISVTYSSVAEKWATDSPDRNIADESYTGSPHRDLKNLVKELESVSEDDTDSDNDTICNSIERIIGTDPNNPDSDHDHLNDSYEISLGLDPMDPDTNKDGLSDSKEVIDVPQDPDGDGIHNGWDEDNDNDGLVDRIDQSPFTKTDCLDSIHLDIKTTGKPLYVSFQVVPKNRDHLKLIMNNADWPYDNLGTMKDLDNSEEDLFISSFIEMKSNYYPEDEDVVEYGISIGEEASNIPLFPEWFEGRIVSLRGKIFFPETIDPVDLDLDLKFKWSVTGTTDTETKAIKASNGKYLTCSDHQTLKANGTEIGNDQSFYWDAISDTNISIRSDNGMVFGINDDGCLTPDHDTFGRNCVFSLSEKDGKQYLLDREQRYLTLQSDGRFKITEKMEAGSEVMIIDDEVKGSSVNLITYSEDFILASASVIENHGTDIGIFHSDDWKEIIGANTVFSSSFCRNYSQSLKEVPALLDDIGIDVGETIKSYSHQDLAIQNYGQKMIQEVQDRYPSGCMISTTMLMEQESAVIGLSELETVLGGSFTANMVDVPVANMRMMRSFWYEVPSNEPMDIDMVLEDMGDEIDDLDDENETVFMGLVYFWSVGEKRVVKNGLDILENFTEYRGIDPVNNWAEGGIIFVDMVLDIILEFVFETVKFIHFAKSIYPSFRTGHEILSKAGFRIAIELFSEMSIWGKLTNFLFGVGIALDIIGWLIDMGMAIFTLTSMLGVAGGDPFLVHYAWLQASITFAWVTVVAIFSIAGSILAFALGFSSIPIAGWIVGGILLVIGIIFGVIEMITSFCSGKTLTDWLLTWFMDWISGIWILTDIDIDHILSDTSIDDELENGLDARDTIRYLEIWDSTVTMGSEKNPTKKQYEDSFIRPEFDISIPYGYENKEKFKYSSYEKFEYIDKMNSTYNDRNRTERYVVGGNATPGMAMKNFPVATSLHIHSNMYFQQYLWWGLQRYSPKAQSERNELRITTDYYDVMPATIGEFANWRMITFLDADGDGIPNKNETGTDVMKWDTDGDLLGDKYEKDFGSNPAVADSDGDGVNDRYEKHHGMNFSSEDTDGDGLTDGDEIKGWIVVFEYYGQEFSWHVSSDPLKWDSDGDGLEDLMEFRCLLNPISKDTDGDGNDDELISWTEITIDPISSIEEGETTFPFHRPDEIVFDEEHNLYCFDRYTEEIIKMNKTGHVQWTIPHQAYDDHEALALGEDGLLYVGRTFETYYPNGTLKGIPDFRWGEAPITVATDDNDNVYYFSYYKEDGWDVGIFNLTVTHPNGSIIRKANFGEGSYQGAFRIFPGEVPTEFSMDVDSDGRIYITDQENKRINVFDIRLEHIETWPMNDFDYINDIHIDDDDFIFISGGGDAENIYMMDRYQRIRASWTNSPGIRDKGVFVGPGENHDLIYICGWESLGDRNGVITIFNKTVIVHEVPEDLDFIDTDSDGLTDVQEQNGWNITVNFFNGSRKIRVNSSIKLKDSDGDGLSDQLEFNLSTDPRNIDTDEDGLPDDLELHLGTNLSSWDNDGDQLDDGKEITFGSDPFDPDSDDDGLDDLGEFIEGTDPNDNDTDDDQLTDHMEFLLGWDPLSQDEDMDFMFDGDEHAKGTNPFDQDEDDDGIQDGYERLYGTEPMDPDCDGDKLPDGLEVELHLDPNNNDTDGDGMDDFTELDVGYNPRNRDSDGDGIDDGQDRDFSVELGEEVIVSMERSDQSDSFLENLSFHVNTKEVSASELVNNYSDKRYIVIIGKPGQENGTPGKIVNDLLQNSGGLLEMMNDSDVDRCVVRYGVWTPEQTVILLSQAYRNDHNRVLGILKSVMMMSRQGIVIANFTTPVGWIDLDSLDIVRNTDADFKAALNTNYSYDASIQMGKLQEFGLSMSAANGIDKNETPMDKVYMIEVLSNGTEVSQSDLDFTEIRLYYRAGDLDLNNDGDMDDPEGLNENELNLYYYTDGAWMKIDDHLEWVLNQGLNTTNQIVHGVHYNGYLYATLAHLSVFGIAGKTNGIGTYLLNVGPVMDENGDHIENANVSIDVDGSILTSSTGELGTAVFELPLSSLGTSVTITIEKEGFHPIHLNTSIDLEGNLIDLIPRLLKIVQVPVIDYFHLQIGPVIDDEGGIVVGALVSLESGAESLSEETNASGIVIFNLTNDHLGKSVIIVISKEGYQNVTFTTNITLSGILDGRIPRLEKTPVEVDDDDDDRIVDDDDDDSKEEDEKNLAIPILIVILIILIIITALAYIIRRKNESWEEEE